MGIIVLIQLTSAAFLRLSQVACSCFEPAEAPRPRPPLDIAAYRGDQHTNTTHRRDLISVLIQLTSAAFLRLSQVACSCFEPAEAP